MVNKMKLKKSTISNLGKKDLQGIQGGAFSDPWYPSCSCSMNPEKCDSFPLATKCTPTVLCP